jgi:hypothetical protein
VFANLGSAAAIELALLVRRIRERHPGRVREVWKHWVHPWSANSGETTAIELAAAAELQGRFWEWHDLVVAAAAPSPSAAPGPPRPLSPRELEGLARAAGLDPQRVGRDQKSGLARAVLDRDRAEARRLDLPQSPALLVNGVVMGRASPERIDRLVSDELNRGLHERLRAPAP